MADILCIKDGSLTGGVKCKSSLGFHEERRSFTMEYQIKTRDLTERWSTLRYDPKLPQLGDLWDGCRCKGFDFKEVKTIIDNGRPATLYEVSYQFDSDMTGSSGWPSGKKTPPDEWAFEWDCDSASFTGPLTHDAVTGELIATPNGEIIPLETDFGELTMNVTGFESLTFDPTVYVQRLYRTNSKTFLNCGVGHVLIKSISARRVPIQGQLWFRCTYNLAIRDNNDAPFTAQVLNHGTKVRTEVDGEIKTTAEVLGRNCTVNLDSDGVMYKGDTPTVLTWNKYRPIDYDTFLPKKRFELALLNNSYNSDEFDPFFIRANS